MDDQDVTRIDTFSFKLKPERDCELDWSPRVARSLSARRGARRALQDRGAAQASQLSRLVLQADRVQHHAHQRGGRHLQALRQVLQRLRRHHQDDARQGARDQQDQLRAHHGHRAHLALQGSAARRVQNQSTERGLHQSQGALILDTGCDKVPTSCS